MRRKLFVIPTLVLVTMLPAAAQNFSVLHFFAGGKADGCVPHAGLAADTAGNLFGTTNWCGFYDFGTVFELPITGGEKVLHNFTSNWDGAYPWAGVTVDANGNIYGTTRVGGYPSCGDIGCGLVFKLSPDGDEHAVHVFKGQGDGGFPFAGLIRDGLGNLYGTAGGDGIFTGVCVTFGCGVVFKLDAAGHESVLHGFTGPPDGVEPVTPLVRDGEGNLYGATAFGGSTGCNGSGCGVIFKVDRTGKETVLYTFTGGTDGGYPSWSDLVLDAAGNLYGTTQYYGDLTCPQSQPWALGCGVIFKLDPAGNQTVLHTFSGGADGGQPNGGLIRDTKGNLYGTATSGGAPSGACPTGCGVVFMLSPVGALTVLHSFRGSDGAGPFGTLLLQNGYLYGVTAGSGNFSGVAFRLRPSHLPRRVLQVR